MVVWGDSEGMLRRPGNDPKAINPAVMKLVQQLQNLHNNNQLDLILSTGDIVRFDPLPKEPKDLLFFRYWPKSLLNKFYPTMGGDEEFLQNKYAFFVNHTPHLQKLAQTAAEESGESGKYYYYTEQHGIHIFSLWSPDNLDELKKTPQWKDEDIFNPKVAPKTPQYRWLVKKLWKIRRIEKDSRPIIVLSHRVVLNRSGKHLLKLFNAFDVDMVLSGDNHVLARKNYKGTHYVVEGMMGDVLETCRNLNRSFKGINGNSFAHFVDKYDACLLEEENIRANKPFAFDQDNYLKVVFTDTTLSIVPIRVSDQKPLSEWAFTANLVRQNSLKEQKRLLNSVE